MQASLGFLQRCNFLIDCTKYALSIRAFDFDANGVTVLHVFRAGFAVQNSFNRAFFSNTAIAFGPKGYSCIAEKRAIETILDGKPSTEYMKYGDTIRIEVKGTDGQSVFGAIDQKIAPLQKA